MLSIWTKLAFIALNLLCRPTQARRYLVSRSILGQQGLFGMNMAFIDRCGMDVHYIMHVMLEESNWPILVHCTAGKDRTGFVIAITQLLCGVPEEEVVADYARSLKCLGKDKMGQLVASAGALGLGDTFAGCPPDVMANTIHYLHTKYNSVDEYLVSIGISLEQQARIRQILVEPF
ncbi:hypothetical protein CXG81DRAFT_11364 [Caulochytrium protostelioides]|uniref:Tyrosine specific protein phosphatases domain-containing protein n=1 Tax=Caulochytrium protostelioides TaxID=1555241 RepID=A0A4P9X9E0_9FUNG|nr:hypothetical protein CXG81DRAFT_11364 [Caulochytrium protostelioides]|eukprot:RKP01954.1 hypothetical protein CXG81DRAFT_11364 [Caulochytrium protostelioides]